jgi:hypothetical protein
MVKIRLVNPSKTLTAEEVRRRQSKAVQFARDVVGDAALVDELESLSLEEYAAKKGFRLSNPEGEEVSDMQTQAARTSQQEISAKLDRLTDAVEGLCAGGSAVRRTNPAADGQPDINEKIDRLSDLIEKRCRLTNPSNNGSPIGPSSPRAQRQLAKLRRERDEILDTLEAVQDALDDDQTDEAQDIVDEILNQYEAEDQE